MKRKKAAPLEKINFPENYYVLGADLSLTRPGFALIEIDNVDGIPAVKDLKLMSVNNKGKKKSHGEILHQIKNDFNAWATKYIDGTKDLFCVREKEIMHMKLPSERNVTKVVGLMDYLAYEKNVEWKEIYPVQVKSLVAGNGRAEKTEVAAALPFYVGEIEYKNDDESDATGVAIAWLIQHGQLKEREHV